MPYPLSSSKGYGGGSGSSGLGYSSIPSSSYMPGFSFFGRHDFSSSGRSPLYGSSSVGSSLSLLGLSSYSMPSSLPSYAHVSPYAAASSSYGSSYGSYGSSSGPKSYYSPLPTISEHSSGPSSGNKRRIPRTYIPVLPLPSTAGNRPALYSSSGVKTLFTEDIDVTTPRKSAVPAEISRKRSGGEGYGTIRRGRTVIRLETKKLKENPYLSTTPPAEEQIEKPAAAEKPKEEEKMVEDAVEPAKEQEKSENPATETAEDNSQLSKDYSQVAKWYEEEMKKPMKKERNAGDKFREKYMVRSRKSKNAGYRRPTLSDIRAQKAVVMKEIEERLKKLADAPPSLPGTEVSEELQVEAQKLEKDKERLARLDKKMAKRFSRALKKAEPTANGDGETSDDESISADRQATMKSVRKLSTNTLKPAGSPLLLCDDQENGEENTIGQRLTRKITKRFFFPQEASSVVQPEIVETLGFAEPEDLYEKNILAQRQTVKMRGTQKKAALITQRKSSASDLELPGNILSDRLCDVDMKSGILEPPEEEEDSKPIKLTPVMEGSSGSSNMSGKKKKYVKKVGDPPAKRVPGNILQPLMTPPKDSDSILESPTEEDIEAAKEAKNKKNVVGKVNGLVSTAQKGLGLGLKSPFLKNNLAAKPIIPNKLNSNNNNKLTNGMQAVGGIGSLPGKRFGDVKSKEETKTNSQQSSTKNKPVSIPVDNNSSVTEPSSTAAAETTKVAIMVADEKKETSNLPQQAVTPPSPSDKKLDMKNANEAGKAASQLRKPSTDLKNEKSETVKSVVDVKNEVEAKQMTKIKEITTTINAVTDKEKPLPVIAKLKPKLALDNKSTSLDGIKPKLKLDDKSSSFDGNDDKKNGATEKGVPGTKKPLMKTGLKQQEKKEDSPVPTLSSTKPVLPACKEKPQESPAQVDKKEDVKTEDKKANKPTTETVEHKVSATSKNPTNDEPMQKKVVPPPVPKKDIGNLDKKETAPPKVENLTPIKKIDGLTSEKKAPEKQPGLKQDEKQPVQVFPDNNNVKKISPLSDNESLAKQNLTPVKVEEKVQQKPGKADAKKLEVGEVKTPAASDLIETKKTEEPAKVEQTKEIPVPQEKPDLKKVEQSATPKEKPDVKCPPPSPKSKAVEQKQIVGAKGLPPKVAPLELKEKIGIKSPPISPKALKPLKKLETPQSESLTSPQGELLDLKKSADWNSPTTTQPSNAINEVKAPPNAAASADKSLPNGHLSPKTPPPSSPKGKGTMAVIAQSTTADQAQQKSPQPSETTQKESVTVGNAGCITSAKVENLGCSAEMTTNDPEKKKKSDSTGDAVITDLSDTPAKINKLGSASENPSNAKPVEESGGNSGQKSISSTTTTNTVGDAVNENHNIATVDTTTDTSGADKLSVDSTAKNEFEGGEDGGATETLSNSNQQSLIRKSLKRGSPRHSSESSISSSGSSASTAKSESGSSTSSTISAGSSAGSRRAPSPPVDDDSDEDRITLDKICPAKTRPKYRKYEIDDFQFLKVLGKGSFGKVLLAELKGSDSYFAIKCLKKDVVLEDDDVECTMIERKVLLMGSKHPYLCHLFCTFQTESHLFFVMEYLNGGDLMFHIQQSGRFAEERARFYGAEIVSGLKFLHKRGVIYRDLKLDNILLDYEGHIRIADFGMCKLQIYLDRMADTFCGTPDYMAPEIIRGLRYNQCVDWWAFGVLMYEMVIGQSPFSGHDEDELFWSVCNEPVHYPRFLSKESKRLLELLLEKDASKRLGTVGCIHGDVKEQPFFQPIDWERLERRELEPPFKPKLKHSLDVQYFDTTFTKEAARLTPVDKEILRSMDQTQFEGFSYTNPHTTD